MNETAYIVNETARNAFREAIAKLEPGDGYYVPAPVKGNGREGTKNKHRGTSKAKRRMAKESRRKNRR